MFEFPLDDLARLKVLGEGEFGVVYLANAIDISGNKGISKVAVKVLKGKSSYLQSIGTGGAARIFIGGAK